MTETTIEFGRERRSAWPRGSGFIARAARGLPLLWILLLLVACGDHEPSSRPILPAGATVLVVGDSLVAGTGASSAESWPARLAERTGWEVINAGVPGDTSADAQARLGALLASHQPDAVILAIGGNDFLRKLAADRTRANIEAMVAESRAVSAHVAILAIPAPSVGGALLGRLSDHAIYERIAEDQGIVLVADAVSRTLSREDFRADRIHANALGYAFLGARVADALAEEGWLAR